MSSNKVTSFCKATSARKEEALYFLEGFNGNLEDAISAFLRDQLPPLKKPFPPLSSQPPWRVNPRYPSGSPSRRRYSTTSVSHQDEKTIMRSSNTAAWGTSLDDRRELHDSNDVSYGEKNVSVPNPVAYGYEGDQGSSVIAAKICESTSIEIDLPYSDPDSISD